MNRGLTPAILVLATLVLQASPAWAKRPNPVVEREGDPGFAPNPESSDAAGLDGDTWKLETKEASIRLRQLPDTDRQAYLREHARSETDPFATYPGRRRGFQTFLLELENRGGGSAIFQPQRCLLIVRQDEVLYPLDLPALESAYGALDRELPPAYRAAARAMLDGERILGPGEKVSGLLIYRAVDPKTKRFTVEVALTTSTGKNIGFEAPYRRLRR